MPINNQLQMTAIGYGVCIRGGRKQSRPHTEQAIGGRSVSSQRGDSGSSGDDLARAAEAKARGTMQATATVVDTRKVFEALSRVQQVRTERVADQERVVVAVSLRFPRSAR